MEQNTSTPSSNTFPDTRQAASGEATPFPVAGQQTSAGDGAADSRQPDANAAASAVPVVDSLLKRVTQRAHEAVDGVADRISSTVEGLQGGVARAGDSRDEWLESAREAIRQHPFAAIGTAVLVGLALRSLSSSRDR